MTADTRRSAGGAGGAAGAGRGATSSRGGGWGGGYGLQVIVQHGSHRVIYAHLSSINIKGLRDKKVAEGNLIGLSGASGNAMGPHLHLEARKAPYRYNVDAVNPMPLITGEPEPTDAPKPAKKAASAPVEVKDVETI